MIMQNTRQSSWSDDLIANPNGKKKYTSAILSLDMTTKMTVRQTYGMLDYFGDIGGLMDFFFVFGSLIFSPIWQFIFSNHLLNKVFRARNDG